LISLIGVIIAATAPNLNALIASNVFIGLGAAVQLSYGTGVQELVPYNKRGLIAAFILTFVIPGAVFGPVIAKGFPSPSLCRVEMELLPQHHRKWHCFSLAVYILSPSEFRNASHWKVKMGTSQGPRLWWYVLVYCRGGAFLDRHRLGRRSLTMEISTSHRLYNCRILHDSDLHRL
jgi:MFS family permease